MSDTWLTLNIYKSPFLIIVTLTTCHTDIMLEYTLLES